MHNIKFFFIVILLLLFFSQVRGQSSSDPWTIGLFVEKTEYFGDLGTNAFKFGSGFRPGFGLSLDRYLNRFFDAGIYGSMSSFFLDNGISHYDDFSQWVSRSAAGNEVKNFHVGDLINLNLHGRFKILGNETGRLVPYIGPAVGVFFYSHVHTFYKDANGDRQLMPYQEYNDGWHDVSLSTSFMLGGIAGLEYRLSPIFSVRYQGVFSWTSRDDLDFHVSGGNDLHLQHNLGLTINFSGKKKDRDGDGIEDYLDRCPKLFGGVDNCGCPPVVFLNVMLAAPEPSPSSDSDSVSVPVEEFSHPVDSVSFVPSEIVVYEFSSLRFGFDEVSIKTPESVALLDSIVSLLIREPSYKITLSGHTDDIGPDSYNQQLSESRAELVRLYLESHGVSSSRISVYGFGSRHPVDNSLTKEGRALNRRVEFLIHSE